MELENNTNQNISNEINNNHINPHEHHMQEMNHLVSSEYEFILEMIPHHQEAITSSKQLLETSTNQELINLANEIIIAQEKEIEIMKEWLRIWYPNENQNAKYLEMMPNLNDFEGIKRDNAYLISMIEHHKMALIMSNSLLSLTNIRTEVQNLANQIILTQEKEIETMRNLIIQ